MADDDEAREAVARAQQYGVLWLNSVFRFKDESHRLFRRGGMNLRISTLEAVWVIVSFVVLLAILEPLSVVALRYIPLIGFVMSPFLVPFECILLSWYTGRRVAHASPLRRSTGEGMGTWLGLWLSESRTRATSHLGRPVAYGMCETIATGARRVVPCVEWIGTARAPFMPPYDPGDEADEDEAIVAKTSPRGRYVILPPRGVPVPTGTSGRSRPKIVDENGG